MGETLESVELGAQKVEEKYGECDEKIIMSVDDAIAANSFYEKTRHSLQRGDASILESL